MIYSKKLNVELNKQGIQGKQGATGAQGEQGPQGPKGDTGAKGADGKNAIVMTSATTPNGEYNGQVGMYNGQFYTWNGSSWILSSGILPTDAVLHYSFDDLPDLPDGTSQLSVAKNTYEVMKNWSKNGGVETTNVNGNIEITTSTLNEGIFKYYTVKTTEIVKIKVKVKTGILNQIGIEGVDVKYGADSGEYIFRGDGKSRAIILYGKAVCVFEVEELYIGDASYSTPVIDNAGNNYTATDVKGFVTKGVSGNSYRTLQNGYVVAKSPLNWNSQYEYSFSTWIKRYTSTVYIANNWNSYSVSTLFLTLQNYADNNSFSRVEAYTKEDKVNRYIANLTLPPIGEWFHYVATVKDGVAVVYINGENQNFKLDYTTEGFHKQTPELLQIGRSFGESGYVTYDAEYDDFQIFDRALSDQEVLGLYLARGNTPKRYTFADYQNSINGGKYHSTTKPTMAFEGDYYLSTTDGYIYSYDGTTWVKITDYNDARYKMAMTDMINLAATNPNVPFLSVTNAWIKNLAAGNILADEIATKDLVIGRKDENGNAQGTIQSANYVEGESGFIIEADGNVEFNKGRFRGGQGTQYIIADSSSGTYLLNGSSFYLKRDKGRTVVTLNLVVDNANASQSVILSGMIIPNVGVRGGMLYQNVSLYCDCFAEDWDISIETYITDPLLMQSGQRIKLTYLGQDSYSEFSLIQTIEDIL